MLLALLLLFPFLFADGSSSVRKTSGIASRVGETLREQEPSATTLE